MQNDSPLRESGLAYHLGLDRDLIRKKRREVLTPADWWIERNEIWISGAGVRRLLAHLKVPLPKKKRDLIEEEAGGPVHTLVVIGICRNEHILVAQIADKNVRVRVRSNRNFLPGMEIPCRHEQADLYALARACPRTRGRW